MKILYCSRTSLAGVCELNARLVNEYFNKVHEARVLNNGPGKHRFYIRPGVKIKRFSLGVPEEVKAALDWADVIACQANVSVRSMGHPELFGKKILVHTWHGAQVWPFERILLPEDYKYVKFVHIGQGWIQLQQSFFDQFKITVLPNLISMDDEMHRPIPFSHRRTGLVAFAPSTTKTNVVNKKGVPEVQRAARVGGWNLDLINCCSFEECLERKRRAVLGIDEVVTPLYHRSGLEFLAQGTPCICSYTDATAATLKEAVGCDSVPFINSTPATLNDTVKRFLGQPADVQDFAGREARRWMETYYHPKVLLNRYFEIYAS